MQKTKPDAVILIVYPDQGISVMQAAEAAGLSPAWFGSDAMTASEVPEIVGSYTEGLIGFVPAHKLTVPSFADRYFERYQTAALDFPVTYGYDAVILLAACISDGGYSADGIRNSLDHIRHIGICGPRIFDANGQVQPAYDVMIVKDGRWELLSLNQILRYDTGSSGQYHSELSISH
jgi:branched-chain amino acid transport system substrate-binding protein